jgi:hypothetical protein
MSIDIMSTIFKAEFTDLEYIKDNETRKAKASTCKLVLLAIADHANEEGEAYPGYTKLEIKTALSRQGLADTIMALKYNGWLSIAEDRSRLNTNAYTINVSKFAQESSHLTNDSQATLLPSVKPLDLNHQSTINKPSYTKNADKKVDAILEAGRQSASKSWTLLPEIFQPLAEAFCNATTLKYKKQFASDWMATISDWLGDGYTSETIAKAVKECVASGMPVTRPGSIDWKLRDLKVKRANVQPEHSYLDDFVPEDYSKAVPMPEELRIKTRLKLGLPV